MEKSKPLLKVGEPSHINLYIYVITTTQKGRLAGSTPGPPPMHMP
jgi:hypothetical protein